MTFALNPRHLHVYDGRKSHEFANKYGMATSRTLFRMKGMRLLVLLFNFLGKSIYRFCIFAVSSVTSAKKMAARFFLHGDHLAKVVLSGTPLFSPVQYDRTFLRPVQYDRIFLDSVQYGNLFFVFTKAI